MFAVWRFMEILQGSCFLASYLDPNVPAWVSDWKLTKLIYSEHEAHHSHPRDRLCRDNAGYPGASCASL